LENEVRKAVATPEVQQRLTTLGLIPVGSTAAAFRRTVADTVKSMNEAARTAGI